MFAVGFMTLLHVMLNRMINFPSWEGVSISTPRITHICDPGTYHSNFTTTAYCQDFDGIIQKSTQCIQCPENMYTDLADQEQCKPCHYGWYAPKGSATCLSCYDVPINNATLGSGCAVFIEDQTTANRQMYMSIFIPLGIIFLTGIGILVWWFFRKRWLQQRDVGSDETWLLSFNDLVKPPIKRTDTDESDDTDQPYTTLLQTNDNRAPSCSNQSENSSSRRESATSLFEGLLFSGRKSAEKNMRSSSNETITQLPLFVNKSNPELLFLDSSGEKGLAKRAGYTRNVDHHLKSIAIDKQPQFIHTVGLQ
jgi:hypothetical protein